MATYLITGVAGFIGSHLAETLLAAGEQVRGVDDLSQGPVRNLAGLAGLDFVRGDVCDSALMAQAMQGVDFVLHHAAVSSIAACACNPQRSRAVNVQGTANVLAAAAAARTVKRVVLASSSAVYGNASAPPLREDMALAPLSAYAAHKAQAEALMHEAADTLQLATVVLRYFNVFGPRQNPDSDYAAVIPKFAASLLQHRAPRINGDGLQTRDFIYVSDVVQANILACMLPEAVGQICNVGSGTPTAILDLLAGLQQALGCAHTPQMGPALPDEVRHSHADTTKAQRILRFSPKMRRVAGLRATLLAQQRQMHRPLRPRTGPQAAPPALQQQAAPAQP